MLKQVFVIGTSLSLSAIGLHAQQGLPSAATVITGAVPMAATAATAVPTLVPYSGIAVGGDGQPLKGELSATFLIFKDQTGGEPLFVETQMIAFDATGHYKTQLGATNSNGLPAGLFSSGEARWLEVQISGQPAESRVFLASVPYSLKAGDAATLGGLPASAFVLASPISGTTAATPDAITPNAATNVTTTGGTNFYLPRFNAATTVINSQIYDNGTSVGIGGVPNAAAKLDVNGEMIMRGAMQVARTGNATASKGYPSYGFEFFSNVYNSSTKATDNPYFALQSEPSGNNTSSPTATFNLLFANNGSAPAETGFYINPNGTVHFASGQTFPGTGTGDGDITGVSAGAGLIGGGTSGNVALAVNTGTIPTLGGNNSFTGTDTFTASINENLDINIDNTNQNDGGNSPGLRFGNASGEGIASERVSGGYNQYGLDVYTDYTYRMSISAGGTVNIGHTPNPENDSKLTVYDDGNASGGGLVFIDGQNGSCLFDTNGNLDCSGNVSGVATSSKIDDPADPANKYLVHGSVQSSEMLNMYSGNATTDGSGSATVALPEWFEAANGDFRYQLTTVGQDARAWVSQEVSGGQFRISTSTPNVKVSWQITAVRQDQYAKAHPLVAEQEKQGTEKGFYQHPELFGQPKEKGISWAHESAVKTKSTSKSNLATR